MSALCKKKIDRFSQNVKEEEIRQKELEELEKKEKEEKTRNVEVATLREEVKRITEDQVKEIQKRKEDIAHKEFLVSKIMQQAALCTLSVRYGIKTVVVSWSLGEDMKGMPGDWVGFYKVGTPTQQYRKCIKTAGSRQGHEHVPAPKTPGLYHFKYFVDGSYNEVVTSDVIHIGPQLTLTAHLVEDQDNEKNNLIEVTYTLKGGELSPDDWFGLYNANQNNNKTYITFHKIGKKLQSSSFQLPAPRTPGDYVVRFFPSLCGYTFVSKSNSVRITNKDKLVLDLIKDDNYGRIKNVKVSWDIHSVDPSSYDYIALYKHDSLNYYYEDYKYLDLQSGVLVFEAPTQVGTYNLRYHAASQSKYADIVRSDTIEILNTDWVRATVGEGVITVTWDIHSQPITTWDWVGIYKTGTTLNTNYVDYKYIDINSKMLLFSAKEPGEYEARYFSSRLGRYTDFRQSNKFIVQ